jgi:hypothetical protein
MLISLTAGTCSHAKNNCGTKSEGWHDHIHHAINRNVFLFSAIDSRPYDQTTEKKYLR